VEIFHVAVSPRLNDLFVVEGSGAGVKLEGEEGSPPDFGRLEKPNEGPLCRDILVGSRLQCAVCKGRSLVVELVRTTNVL
jgi:hypothetical protein